MMRRRAALALVALLAGCTTGQANTTPPISGGGTGPSNPGVLQLAVGTVNFAGAATGLNVLETFRGSNGYSAVPITSATLAGPATLHGVRASKDPGADANGTFPLGSAANAFVIGSAGVTTVLAGADGFGIGPPGCGCPGTNFYPMQPQFADNPNFGSVFPGGAEPFYGGPPAYPPTALAASALSSLVNIPTEWPEGFYLIGFDAVPSGAYTLHVSYAQNGVDATTSASASLDAKRVLPFLGAPSLTAHRDGSLSVAMTLPRGVTEAIVNVIDANVPPVPNGTCTTGLGFASLVFKHSGTQRVPADLGNYGAGDAQTFCAGDLLDAQAFGFDYDDAALGPPGNTAQRPVLPAQADVTISYPAIAAVPGKRTVVRRLRWPRFR